MRHAIFIYILFVLNSGFIWNSVLHGSSIVSSRFSVEGDLKYNE